MTTTPRPRTITDFRRLGKRRLAGRSAAEAKRLHDEREAAKPTELPKTYRARVALRFHTIPLGQQLTVEYQERARDRYPRRKNWEDMRPGDYDGAAWGVISIDNGRYSSRVTYTHWTYRVFVRSCGAIIRGLLLFKFADEPLRKIAPPHGYRWDRDRHGLRLVNSTGDDYHPTADDLRSMTRRELAAQVRENAATRRAERAKARQQLRAVRTAEAEGAAVCILDSVTAGNCRAGSASWARQHDLDPHQHISPSELLALANGDASRVAIVVSAALRRHRREMDQGYCDLSDHTY